MKGPISKPFSRLNLQCRDGSGYEWCITFRQFYKSNCQQKLQKDHDGMICLPSQLTKGAHFCNRKYNNKYKICDGAFEWCHQGAPATSELRKIKMLDDQCNRRIANECNLRYRCYQRCLQKQQSGECNFFAINPKTFTRELLSTENCEIFSALDGTNFSTSSCGPWKIYQMSCANNSSTAEDAISNTTASTPKAENFTTVSGLSCTSVFALRIHILNIKARRSYIYFIYIMSGVCA